MFGWFASCLLPDAFIIMCCYVSGAVCFCRKFTLYILVYTIPYTNMDGRKRICMDQTYWRITQFAIWKWEKKSIFLIYTFRTIYEATRHIAPNTHVRIHIASICARPQYQVIFNSHSKYKNMYIIRLGCNSSFFLFALLLLL